jgi:RNA-directed DNA polymerase
LPSANLFSGKYKRLNYCRYADDFILGVIGSYTFAVAIKDKVTSFLREKLHLDISPEKTSVASGRKGIHFLSYQINTLRTSKLKKSTYRGRRTTRRTIIEQIQLRVPKDKAKEFCNKYGYGDWQQTKPAHRSNLANGSTLEIIDTYNVEFRGLAEYYALSCDMKLKLQKLNYMVVYSLFKTLANKYKCKKSKVIPLLKRGDEYIYRYQVNGEQRERKIFQLKHLTTKPKWIKDELPKEKFYLTAIRSELVKRMNAKKCEYCDTRDALVEVHHVQKLKDLNPNSTSWERVMIARRRKTLVLCRNCHTLLHKGELPDIRYNSDD